MMASLIQQHGFYYLQFYSAKRKPQRQRVPLRVRLKRDAEKVRRKLERDYALGTFDPWTDDPLEYDRVHVQPETLRAAAELFYDSRSHLATRTQQEYRKIVSRFVAFAGPETRIQSVESRDVHLWLDSTRAGPVTRHNYARHLKVFFRWAKSEGITATVATDEVKLRRLPRKFPRYLNREEVDRIAAKAQDMGYPWLSDLVRVAVLTGLRRSELVNLRWEHVDLEARRIVVANTQGFRTKSGADRVVPLATGVTQVLLRRQQASSSPWVFTHSQGQIDADYLSRKFKTAAREAGIPDIHLHHLRHTACSWLAEQGVPVEVIRRFAGHSTITVTEKYMHVRQDMIFSTVLDAFG